MVGWDWEDRGEEIVSVVSLACCSSSNARALSAFLFTPAVMPMIKSEKTPAVINPSSDSHIRGPRLRMEPMKTQPAKGTDSTIARWP